MLKTSLRKCFEACGLDVRLIRNLKQARQAEKRKAVVDKWRLLTRFQPRTILDIGANEGQFARLIREIFPDVMLYSFEPIQDCFLKLDEFHKESGHGKAFPYALGESTGVNTIHRSAFTPSSSLLKMGKLHAEELPNTAKTWREEIQIRRLDDIVSEMNIETPLVIKVDVQGFENQVIEGGRKIFAQAGAVVMELSSYELYENQSTFESVEPVMRGMGFVFRGVVDQMLSPRDGRILQYDALFEKNGIKIKKN
jgi:FkbM family methyltransferase